MEDWPRDVSSSLQRWRAVRKARKVRAGHLGYLARRRIGKTNQMTAEIRSRAWVTRNLEFDIFDKYFRKTLSPEVGPSPEAFFLAQHRVWQRALRGRKTSQYRLAKLFGVSRAMIQRWLAKCPEKLNEAARDRMMDSIANQQRQLALIRLTSLNDPQRGEEVVEQSELEILARFLTGPDAR